MAVSLGEHGITNGNQTALSVTKTIAAGSCVVVYAWAQSHSFTVSDDRSSVFTEHEEDVAGNRAMVVAFALNHAGGLTQFTVTLDSGPAFFEMGMLELLNVKASAAEDDYATNAQASTAAPASGEVTTTAAGAVVGLIRMGGDALTITEDTGDGWALVDEDETGNGQSGSVVWKATAAGTYNPDWTLSIARQTRGQTLALLEAAGGGADPRTDGLLVIRGTA